MATKTGDEIFMESLLAINDPIDMLEAICENQDYLGYDPYYSDFRECLLGQAEKIVKKFKAANAETSDKPPHSPPCR